MLENLKSASAGRILKGVDGGIAVLIENFSHGEVEHSHIIKKRVGKKIAAKKGDASSTTAAENKYFCWY